MVGGHTTTTYSTTITIIQLINNINFDFNITVSLLASLFGLGQSGFDGFIGGFTGSQLVFHYEL